MLQMNELGKTLLGLGLLIAIVGVLLLLAGRIGLPLGRLPGDIAYRENMSPSSSSRHVHPDQRRIVRSLLVVLSFPPLGRRLPDARNFLQRHRTSFMTSSESLSSAKTESGGGLLLLRDVTPLPWLQGS